MVYREPAPHERTRYVYRPAPKLAVSLGIGILTLCYVPAVILKPEELATAGGIFGLVVFGLFVAGLALILLRRVDISLDQVTRDIDVRDVRWPFGDRTRTFRRGEIEDARIDAGGRGSRHVVLLLRDGERWPLTLSRFGNNKAHEACVAAIRAMLESDPPGSSRAEPETPPSSKPARTKPAAAKKEAPEVRDGAQTAWVVALLACPLLGWLVASSIMVDWTLASWKWRSIVGAAIGVGVPVLLALAAMREVPGRSLGFLVVTAVPAAFFQPTFARLLDGPHRVEGTVEAVTCDVHERRGGVSAPCLRWRVRLTSGGDALYWSATSVPGKGKRVCATVLDDVVLGGC